MFSFKDPRETAVRLRSVAQLLTAASDANIVRQYAEELERAQARPLSSHEMGDVQPSDRGIELRSMQP